MKDLVQCKSAICRSGIYSSAALLPYRGRKIPATITFLPQVIWNCVLDRHLVYHPAFHKTVFYFSESVEKTDHPYHAHCHRNRAFSGCILNMTYSGRISCPIQANQKSNKQIVLFPPQTQCGATYFLVHIPVYQLSKTICWDSTIPSYVHPTAKEKSDPRDLWPLGHFISDEETWPNQQKVRFQKKGPFIKHT